jgi:hypothetical protein
MGNDINTLLPFPVLFGVEEFGLLPKKYNSPPLGASHVKMTLSRTLSFSRSKLDVSLHNWCQFIGEEALFVPRRFVLTHEIPI